MTAADAADVEDMVAGDRETVGGPCLGSQDRNKTQDDIEVRAARKGSGANDQPRRTLFELARSYDFLLPVSIAIIGAGCMIYGASGLRNTAGRQLTTTAFIENKGYSDVHLGRRVESSAYCSRERGEQGEMTTFFAMKDGDKIRGVVCCYAYGPCEVKHFQE